MQRSREMFNQFTVDEQEKKFSYVEAESKVIEEKSFLSNDLNKFIFTIFILIHKYLMLKHVTQSKIFEYNLNIKKSLNQLENHLSLPTHSKTVCICMYVRKT
jgi:regulator of PEP synthase PpsR (kinase-PPPase family)